jgi:hypothetical protein
MSLVTESPVLTTTCVSTGVARHRVTCVDDLTLSVLSSEPRFALATKRKYGLLSAQRWERVESTDVTQSWECVNQVQTHGREGGREGVSMCFRVYACVHVRVYLCARVRLWWCILLCLQLLHHRIVNLHCWSSVSQSVCVFAHVTSHAVTDLCETERVR